MLTEVSCTKQLAVLSMRAGKKKGRSSFLACHQLPALWVCFMSAPLVHLALATAAVLPWSRVVGQSSALGRVHHRRIRVKALGHFVADNVH